MSRLDRRHKWGKGERGEDQHFHYTCQVCGKTGIRHDLDVLMEEAWKKYWPIIDNTSKINHLLTGLKAAGE